MSLKVNNITFGYTDYNILENVSFQVKQGEILSLLGANGTGKTTLIKCINNIISPQCGQVIIDDKDIFKMTPKCKAKYFGYVPQYTQSSFSINVIDTIMMGRIPLSGYKIKDKDKKVVFDIIKKMELQSFAFKNINEMSGGERQRVFIARALVQEPKILFLDEPTSSLDMKNQLFILQLINNIVKEKNLGVIMSIHDLNLVSMFSDKIVILKNASVFAYGIPNDVINEENIKSVYGVNSSVTIEDGFKHVRLIKQQ